MARTKKLRMLIIKKNILNGIIKKVSKATDVLSREIGNLYSKEAESEFFDGDVDGMIRALNLKQVDNSLDTLYGQVVNFNRKLMSKRDELERGIERL